MGLEGDSEALGKAYSDPHLKNARACPFCGTEHLALTPGPPPKRPWQRSYRVFCPGCFARGPTANFAQHAVDRWNGNFLTAWHPSKPPT
jgi:hypothetical protein